MRGNNRRDQNINYACCAFGLKLFATRFARSATDNPADAASISKPLFQSSIKVSSTFVAVVIVAVDSMLIVTLLKREELCAAFNERHFFLCAFLSILHDSCTGDVFSTPSLMVSCSSLRVKMSSFLCSIIGSGFFTDFTKHFFCSFLFKNGNFSQ